MNYIYLDTEYSGFFSTDLNKTGELLQVSCIAEVNGVELSSFNEYCRPLTKRWSSSAEEVHKISRDRAQMFQNPNDLAEKLIKWIESLGDNYFTIKAYNHKGDKQYIERLMHKSNNLDTWFNLTRPAWIDVLDRVKKRKDYITTKNQKLETLCNYFGIEINAHDAMSDTRATMLLDHKLDGIKLPRKHVQIENTQDLTHGEKVRKYMSSAYVQQGGRGCLYITEKATSNPEALQIIFSELYNKYCIED